MKSEKRVVGTIHPDSSRCHYPPFAIIKMALVKEAKEDNGSEEDISIVEINCIPPPQLPIEEQEWHKQHRESLLKALSKKAKKR
jgi:hypothetical protein